MYVPLLAIDECGVTFTFPLLVGKMGAISSTTPRLTCRHILLLLLLLWLLLLLLLLLSFWANLVGTKLSTCLRILFFYFFSSLFQ